jgi:glycosidase
VSKAEFAPVRHFHPTRAARDKYGIEDPLFTLRGNVVFADYRDAQSLAHKMNEMRKAQSAAPPVLVQPAELFAAGLIHEVYHFIIQRYRASANPQVFGKCEVDLQQHLGNSKTQDLTTRFGQNFPPQDVYKNRLTLPAFLAGQHDGAPNRHLLLEELMLVWIENQNPALHTFKELFDDVVLRDSDTYDRALTRVDTFFDSQPRFGREKLPLIKLLLEPIKRSPVSVMGQIDFIREEWSDLLSEFPLFSKLVLAQDYIREEGKFFLLHQQAEADRSKMPNVTQTQFWGWGEKESLPVTDYRAGSEWEPEKFSADLNWMPRLVLIAKTTFVWLDQLSKKYGRVILRLDEIPDEELDLLASRGFTGLWLIGIWKRSDASRRIKHLHGNTDAVASAYSLYSYEITPEIGGEEGYKNLRERAMRRGIRVASDMVPNHMGLDSEWAINHPDWFIQTPYPPFPNYTFGGPDLSSDDRVGIFIEDGYWRKTDAAVVYKRLDRWTGDVRYIYHGNDGTNIPWNDTAQLNFLMKEVREAVIQTILYVAKLFPVIRLDAAMVLAKKSIQRLWFPLPGSGGAIPSRAGFSMTKEQFDELIPVEFWREVVDRVQQEAPDTLLLAEAFWMMEGFFVRTLGMHRVYNSAFMNMMKKEENANYRLSIRNVLEYNPQILKRYVNFLNNPDEDTAVAQFGKDDKYFGVSVLMATMPGLPMFGHGQVEGLTEKYGHEYRRAYYQEQPDEWLIARHEREIFPLLKKRYLFSDVEHFLLYDVQRFDGSINEDVFAYSNRFGGERGLVLYHNTYATAEGWIRISVGFLGSDGEIVRRTLGEGLALTHEPNTYCIFRDWISGLEFIHANDDFFEKGLFVRLEAFKYQVFMDFREVQPSREKPYDSLARTLNGRGVASIEEELLMLRYRPIHETLRKMICAESLADYMSALHSPENALGANAFLANFRNLAWSVRSVEGAGKDLDQCVANAAKEFESLRSLASALREKTPRSDWKTFAGRKLPFENNPALNGWRELLLAIVVTGLRERSDATGPAEINVVDHWRLREIIASEFVRLGVQWDDARKDTRIVALLSTKEIDEGLRGKLSLMTLAGQFCKLPAFREFVGVNTYQEIEYFAKEKLDESLDWLTLARIMHSATSAKSITPGSVLADAELVKKTAAESGYRMKEFGVLLLTAGASKKSTPVPTAKTRSIKKIKPALRKKKG